MIAGATRKVCVISPFIDATGVEVLSAASDRNTFRPNWEVYLRASPPVVRRAATRRGWKVYEYRGTPGGDEKRGFHCKMVLADDCRAVLGSANLTHENLVANVELGVLLEDKDEMRPLISVPPSLRRASRRVL